MATKEDMKELQELVDTLREQSQFANYVKHHKLGLIDSRFDIVDKLLDTGVLKG